MADPPTPAIATATALPLDPATWTAVAALWGRAVEQTADHPLIRDPAAAAWLEALGLDTSRLSRATATQVAVCARAKVIDAWVAEWAHDHAPGVVVELGVGFSTRAQRLADRGLDFVGVDQVNAAQHRDPLDAPRGQPTLRADVTSARCVEALQPLIASRPVCFIAEGLFMFLEARQVATLLSRLATAFPGSALLFDAYAPPALYLQCLHDSLGHLGETLRSTRPLSPNLEHLESRTLRDSPAALRRLPWVYRLPGVHRLHATHRAVLRLPESAR